MDVNILASWTIVLGFAGGVFSWVILRPLNSAVENLNKAIKELREELSTAERRRHELELKVAEVEQRAKSNTHRLDKLEGVIKNEA